MTARGVSLVLLRVLLWGMTAAVLLVLGLGATARGTAWLARGLSALEPRLELAHRDGNLLEARFARIAWRDAGLVVELREVAWTLSPRCLTGDVLCFAQFQADALDIDLGPASGASSPLALAPVMLPLELVLEHGTLGTLHVRRGAESLLRLHDIALSAGMRGSRIDVARLDAHMDQLGASLSGRVELRAQLPIEAAGELRWGALDRAELQAHGDLGGLAFSARTAGRYAVDLDGRVDALARPLALAVRARSREALVPDPARPDLAALHDATLDVAGTLEALRGELSAQLESAALGRNALTATATWTPGRLELGAVALRGEAGALAASGHVETRAGGGWALRAEASDFCPTGWAPALACRLGGTVTADGTLGPAGVLEAAGELAGELNGHPARIAGGVAMDAGGQWRLRDLRLASGTNTLTLDGSVGERLELEATLAVGRLADTIATAAGSGGGSFRVRGSPDDPQLAGTLELHGLAWNGLAAGSLALQADWRGLAQAGNSVRLALSDGRYGDIGGIALDATLTGAGAALGLALAARAADAALRLDCSGALATDTGWRGQCRQAEFAGPGAEAPWRGDRAITLDWRRPDGELRIDPFCLRRDAAALCSRAQVRLAPGRVGGVAIAGSAIPFAWLAPWLPEGLRADGAFDIRVDADAAAGQSPRLAATASTGAMSLGVLAAGEPLAVAVREARAELATDGTGLRLGWTLALADGAAFDGEARLEPAGGALSGRMALERFDLAPYAMLAPGVVAAAGRLDGDIRLGGSLREPRLAGSLHLRDGMLGHERLPQPVEDVQLDVDFAGTEARLAGRFATAAGAGELDGTARFAGEGWSADLALRSDGLKLEPARDSELTVVPRLRVLLDPQRASISGEVFVPTADIRLDRLPASAVSVSPDAVIVGEEPKATPFDYDMTLAVRLGDAVRLRGRGVDARLEGALELRRNAGGRRLRASGEIRIPEGRYTAYGQDLEVTEGSIRFRGPLDRPELRLTAIRRIEDENIQVGVRVRGDLRDPELSSYSRPAMEESRAMHYLLTGRAPDAGGNSDLAVAGMLMQLGAAGASKLTGNVLSGFGIQDFQLATREVEGGTEVHLSGYLSPDLYLRYGVSTFDKVNTFRLRYRLHKSFFVEAVSGIENAVDFLYSFER